MTESTKNNPIDLSVRPDIYLGNSVREKITGFTGIVTSVSHEIDGSIFMGVQPRTMKDNEPADAHEFDIDRLERHGDDDVILNTNGVPASSIELGALYKDAVTDVVGTAVRVIEFIGGCNRVTIRPKVDKDGKLQESIMIPLEQVVLVSEGIAAEAKKKKTPTGGPNSTDRRIMGRMSS